MIIEEYLKTKCFRITVMVEFSKKIMGEIILYYIYGRFDAWLQINIIDTEIQIKMGDFNGMNVIGK